MNKPLPVTRATVLQSLIAGLALAAVCAQGSNVLQNPGFEASSGAWPPVVPPGWSYYGPPDNWYVEPVFHTGNNCYKIWGSQWTSGATNVIGIYQDKTCAAGWTYAASGWFYSPADPVRGPHRKSWVEVSFRDSSDAVLSLYKTTEFTTDFAAGLWFQLAVTNVCDINPSANYAVTGSVAQLVAPVGTAKVRYQFASYQEQNEAGDMYLDDTMLDQLVGPVPPVISNVLPNNLLLAKATNGISFTVSSPSSTTINNSGIHLILNGTDVSSSLSYSGTDTSKNVTYSGLVADMNYSATINATDTQGLSVSYSFAFDTRSASFIWEAEDYNFGAGQYIDNPVLTNVAGVANSYYGKAGTNNVDFYDDGSSGATHLYRPDDTVGIGASGDGLRQNYLNLPAEIRDYSLGWVAAGEWLNYTRTYPAGYYNVYGRLAVDGSMQLSLGTLDANTNVTELGTFSLTSSGWTTWKYVPLLDSNGNLAGINLPGGVQTMRVTAVQGGNMNFFMLVPGNPNTPTITDFYPDGSHPFQYTNRLAFHANSPNSTVPNDKIQVTLDGIDVSSQLNISGSGGSKTVMFDGLLLNARHAYTIKVTDANGLSTSLTKSFDTFTETNFIVDAKDFDYDGGKFIDDPTPLAYIAVADAITNVDFSHTAAGNHPYQFRANGIPTEAASDYVRQSFTDAGLNYSYNLGYFDNPDWANYTRTYPAGKYVVYGRLAGGGGYTVYLDQVTSGVGTTNQTTKRLGRWSAQGSGWQSYDWVPLTDNGLASPIVVTLDGQSTLRIQTTGGCNVNYFMLVPATGIVVNSSFSGGKVNLSFPTQYGVNYRIFYRDDVGSGDWTLLNTVPGDGSVKTFSETPTGTKRYYRVVAP